MDKAVYRTVAWLCIISGNFLAFSGAVTSMWLTNTINSAGLSDPSELSPIYTYASVLVFGGMSLIVVGIILIWHVRRAPMRAPKKLTRVGALGDRFPETRDGTRS